MNRGTLVGTALTVTGLGGYAFGVLTPYPGRAFSVTLVMVGITVIAMRSAFDGRELAG